jgi:alkanesulfonate monooxygenase SsuD/methylene tetrahydromethanopterin reductase-like flavin-dependent oxidoreductase (luciferase family)
MRFAVDVAPMGPYADPRRIVELAVAAERAGWDGLSTWDVLGIGMGAPAADPFLALAAVATVTERLRLIASVIILPRRRPQLVAQAAATLDALSGGRFTLGIGAGGDPEDFTAFGESFAAAPRVARLDEDAARLDGWLRADGSPRLGPGPVQQPRMPIWVGGARPGALRRAARYEGWIAVATGEDYQTMRVSPEVLAAQVAVIRGERAAAGRAEEPFDVGLFAHSDPGDGALVAAYQAAGVTWWLESLSPLRGSHEELLARVVAGPAR